MPDVCQTRQWVVHFDTFLSTFGCHQQRNYVPGGDLSVAWHACCKPDVQLVISTSLAAVHALSNACVGVAYSVGSSVLMHVFDSIGDACFACHTQ